MEVKNVKMGYAEIATDKILSTTLGSCISICFIERHKKIAAMTHYMVPYAISHYTEQFGRKSGENLLNDTWNELMKKNILPSQLEVYVFGGGEMMDANTEFTQIGKQNIQFAKQWLASKRLNVKEHSIGGQFSRLVKLNPQTGEVICKKIPRGSLEFDGSKLYTNKSPKMK